MADFIDGCAGLIGAVRKAEEGPRLDKTLKFILSSSGRFPSYLDAVRAQRASERRLRDRAGDLEALQHEAQADDKARSRAHDLAQYACVRLNALCDRYGLGRHICPEVPEPDAPSGHLPGFRDEVAGFAARATLDACGRQDVGQGLAGRELLYLAVDELEGAGAPERFESALRDAAGI